MCRQEGTLARAILFNTYYEGSGIGKKNL